MLLRDKDRDAIICIAKKVFYDSLHIWVYGSRVNGEAHDMSDLDLVLIAKDGNKVNMSKFMDFKELLTDSNIPIPIQILDWQRIPKSFYKNILENYEELI